MARMTEWTEPTGRTVRPGRAACCQTVRNFDMGDSADKSEKSESANRKGAVAKHATAPSLRAESGREHFDDLAMERLPVAVEQMAVIGRCADPDRAALLMPLERRNARDQAIRRNAAFGVQIR